jgi:peptide/nickel transport system permease protein
LRRYLIRRIAVSIPLLLGLVVLTFFYIRLVPGDPAEAALGVNATPQAVAGLRHEYGLDRPLSAQFGSWVTGLVHGNLGRSFSDQQPISSIVVGRIPATLQLALSGLLVAILLAVPFGLLAGRRPGSLVDTALTSVTLFGLAIPSFWLGTVLVVLFSLDLHLLPSQGYVPFTSDPVQSVKLTVLPAITLGLAIAPYLARLVRATVADTVVEPFVGFATTRGLPQGVVTRKYLLRNVWPGLVTVIGLTVGFLLAGSVIVEQLFNWPGTGRLIVESVIRRDYTTTQALILIYGVVFILVNLTAEIVQSLLDPRIRLS